MSYKCTKHLLSIFLILVSSTTYAHPQSLLSLSDVEKIALETAPEILELQNNEKSFDEAAVAANTWPDPQLMAGAMNVPTDTFSFDQENMTQIKLGLSQMIPKGKSLQFKSEKNKMMSLFSKRMNHNTKAIILRTVRQEWLNIYYWLMAEKIVNENRAIFKHLVKVTESLLSAGKNNQHDVLRAQLELSQIDNRKIQISEEIGKARARLARWIGHEKSEAVLPRKLPQWMPPPSVNAISKNIANHPLLTSSDALVEATKQDVRLSEEDYKPGFMVGVNYSLRQGDNPMSHERRSDFLSAQVTMDLPIFTSKRQDKRLASKIALLHASKDKRMRAFKDMQSHLAKEYVRWEKLKKQSALYKKRLIPEAKQYASATLTAYQNHQSDYPAVAKAYVTELNTKLEGLKINVELNKSRIELMYLEGQHP